MRAIKRGRGIEIGHGGDMARLLADRVDRDTDGQTDDYAAAPAFLVPSVLVRLPRRSRSDDRAAA